MPQSAAEGAKQQAEEAVHEAAPWVKWLARAGYASKGSVYIIVGAIAVRAAFAIEQHAVGSTGALLTVLRQPLGQIMLGALAIGFLGYALWRLVQALLDPERRGTDARALMTRAGLGIAALIYIGLAVEAARLLIGPTAREDIRQAEQWVTLVMEAPLGRVVVGLVGIGILIFGLYELYKAYRIRLKRFDSGRVGREARTWIRRLSRAGYVARGIVFGLAGFFVAEAAIDYEPDEIKGVGEVLRAIRIPGFGRWLLVIVALGLVAYGLFQLAKARYRRIHPG